MATTGQQFRTTSVRLPLRSCLHPTLPRSHYLSVPPGAHLLSDALLTSPILAGDRGIPEEAMGDAGAPSGAGAGGFEFGVDPSLDPELAMVRRDDDTSRLAKTR